MINSRKILLVVDLHQCITPGSVSGLKVIFAKEKPLLPSNDEIKNFHSQVYFFYMICFSKFFFVEVFVSEVKRNFCKKFFSFLLSFSLLSWSVFHLLSENNQLFSNWPTEQFSALFFSFTSFLYRKICTEIFFCILFFWLSF